MTVVSLIKLNSCQNDSKNYQKPVLPKNLSVGTKFELYFHYGLSEIRCQTRKPWTSLHKEPLKRQSNKSLCQKQYKKQGVLRQVASFP